MRRYFLSKLSDINIRMSIHAGNANERLASEVYKILLLPRNEVPDLYRSEFSKLLELIELTINNLPTPGLVPSRLGNIHNKTASKFIKLLIDIKNEVETLRDSELEDNS